MKVAVLDLELGNLMSMKRGLERAGADVSIVNSDEGPEMGSCGTCCISGCSDADAVVMPGVGSFKDGMKAISKFTATLNEIKDGKSRAIGSLPRHADALLKEPRGRRVRRAGADKGQRGKTPNDSQGPPYGLELDLASGG